MNGADVAAAGADPVAHFCPHGWREGRRPNLFYDPLWSRSRYLAAERPNDNPLAHSIRQGERDGASRSAVSLRPGTGALPGAQACDFLFSPSWRRASITLILSRRLARPVQSVFPGRAAPRGAGVPNPCLASSDVGNRTTLVLPAVHTPPFLAPDGGLALDYIVPS